MNKVNIIIVSKIMHSFEIDIIFDQTSILATLNDFLTISRTAFVLSQDRALEADILYKNV